MGMKVVEMPVSDLVPYENNPRNNDNAVDAVAASIREFGFKVPIIVDKDGVIVAGHTRLKAAKKLGIDVVPVIRADDLTEEQVRAFRLADNKTGELAEWDFEKLTEELSAIEMDMQEFGFLPEEAVFTPDDVTGDEFDIKPPEIPEAAEGSLYELGSHRLMCGDSTDEEAVKILMNGERADMVFTDPPYGVAIGSKNQVLNTVDKGGHCQENIENDAISEKELYKILVKAMTNLREIICKEDCSYYVSSPQGGSLGMMMMMMKDAGLEVRHLLVWVKNIATFSMGRLDYDYRHEPIMYTWTKKHNFYGKNQNTVIDNSIDNSIDIESLPYEELLSLTKRLLYPQPDSVIYENKPMKSNLHPTMKPIKLITKFILNSSKTGDIVADIFGGSGSTLIACEQTGRVCYMMEKDPKYVDVIVKRWEEFTGKKAVKLH